MHIELVMTGEELLDGRVLNSNERDIAQMLFSQGFRVIQSTTVGDDPSHLQRVFEEASRRARVVLVTGGLGPTDDDRTAAILAQMAGVHLERNEAIVNHLRTFFAQVQRPMAESNLKQADLPKGAIVLPNAKGTAPGFQLQVGACHFFAMPGVPREMKAMMQSSVLPTLLQLAGEQHTSPQVHTLRCFGTGESHIADRLRDLYPLPDGVEIGYRAHFPEIHIKISVTHAHSETAQTTLQSLTHQVRERVAAYFFAEGKTSFVQHLAELLQTNQHTLALAESCTGGLIAHKLTALPGSSAYFLLSAVTYSNEAKQTLVGVDEATLLAHGAVSRDVACEMAQGAQRAANSTLAAAVTGIAGPSGGSEEKPVGTVHIAIATPDTVTPYHFCFPGGRSRVQQLTAYATLELLRRHILGSSHPGAEKPIRYSLSPTKGTSSTNSP